MSSKYVAETPRAVSAVGDTKRIEDRRPDKCGVFGCRNKVDVLQVIVLDDSGHEHSGWWSDFSRSPSELKAGFQLMGWVPRCTDHFLGDVYAARRGVDSPITGTSTALTYEAVEAHWARLEAAA